LPATLAATFPPLGTLGVPLDVSPDKFGFLRATTSGADIRLSTDMRYQLPSGPIDERGVGERPPGSRCRDETRARLL